MPNDLPFEDTPPITEPPMTGEPDHDEADDDSWSNIEVPEEGATVTVTQDQAEPGPDHPSDPAVVPIQPEPKLSHYVALSVEEMAEKGKLLARKLVEIAGLEEERKDINHQIKDLDDEVTKLRNALIAGTVEVMTEQTDLLRQPVGALSAATQFENMAKDAEAAQASPEAQEEQKTVEDLNAMAKDIQAGVPGTEASPQFENDVENFKAKKAKERKGKK